MAVAATGKVLFAALVRALYALDGCALAQQYLGRPLYEVIISGPHFERIGVTLLLVVSIAEVVHLTHVAGLHLMRRLRHWKNKRGE